MISKFIPVLMTAAVSLSGCKIVLAPDDIGIGPPEPVTASIDKKYAFGRNKIRVYSEGRANDPNKVRICLHNPSSSKNKAFHFRPDKKPRYVTKRKGDLVCGEHPAGPHTASWYMYRQNPIWKIVGTIDFNATGFAGQRVTFAWYDD